MKLSEMLNIRKEPTVLKDEALAREFPKNRQEYHSEGLALEDPELFNMDPLTFDEMASSLADDVTQLHSIAVLQSRYSEGYLSLSRLLEKGIAELASCCVTKAVFEKQGLRFPNLGLLDISLYHRIVAGHFRKCHAAVSATTISNQKFWIGMLETEIRWYNLARRLKATEDRIRLIREGKISIDKMLEKLEYDRLRERSSAQKAPAKHADVKALPESRAVSFPVMGETLREAFGNSRKQEPAPAPDAEPKVYASMKQRKKAERLARKHAAEQSAAAQKKDKSPDREKAASLQMPCLFGRDPVFSDENLWEEADAFPIELLSKGVPLPVRA